MKDAAERKSGAVAAIEPAATRAHAAAEERDAARSALEVVQRAHAAAHAAEGCQPGDPCPVCQRPLPAGFAMPRPPGEADARAKLKATEQAADQATKDLATREADLRNASDDLDRAGQAAHGAEATLGDVLSDLRLIVPHADLDADDDAVLAPLAAAVAAPLRPHTRRRPLKRTRSRSRPRVPPRTTEALRQESAATIRPTPQSPRT